MRSGRVAWYALVFVFLEFLCHVQCQRIVQVDIDVDPKDVWTPGPGRTSSVGDHYGQWRPTAVPTVGPLTTSSSLHGGGRTRRNFNATKGVPFWIHEFEIKKAYFNYESGRPRRSQLIALDNFKNTLQSMDFEFLNPKGLRISISDGNATITIFEFSVSLNEVVGDFTKNTNRTVGGWSILAPELKVKPGDEVYYQIDARLDKERLFVIVDGTLAIEGKIHQVNGSNQLVQFCPEGLFRSYRWAEVHNVHQMTLSQTVRWNHLFTTGPTYPFNIKLGEEFQVLDSGDFEANFSRGLDGRWCFYYPNVILEKGDKIYYWMRIIFDLEFDFTVRGELEVTLENPYTRPPSMGLDSLKFCAIQREVDISLESRIRWDHRFTITSNSKENCTMESANKWMEDEKVLKNILEFGFHLKVYPRGLGISISGANENFIISAFKMKYDDDFNDINYLLTTENFTELGYDNIWRYFYPNLEVHPGDKLYYWMRVTFGESTRESIVRGVIEKKKSQHTTSPKPATSVPPTHVKPFLRIRNIQSRPSSFTPSTFVGVLPGGTVEGAFRWSNRFTITAPSDAIITVGSAEKWLEDARRLKKMLENDLYFNLLNSTFLRTSIPGNNTYYRALDFNIKLNGKVQNKTSGDDYARDYADLELNAGDKIEYSMSLSLTKHNFRGQLEILGL